MSDMYVFYNKNNLEIMTIARPNDTIFNIEDFKKSRIEHDPNYAGMSINDIAYVIDDGKEYDYLIQNGANIQMSINPITYKLDINIKNKDNPDNEYLLYDAQEFKRDYSVEDISNIYHEDYINFNLKNIIDNNIFRVEFVKIKDLVVRTSISETRWDSFFTDPYLKDMGNDRLALGRDIIKRGSYYTVTVSEFQDPEHRITVLEGNHRILSLRLLQSIGELSDDFKMLCIFMPEDCNNYLDGHIEKEIDFKVKTRHIIENKYGSNIIRDPLLMSKAKERELSMGAVFVNDYTFEFETNKVSDLIFGIHAHTIWLRDLIFPITNLIEPSKIINDENAFLKWKGQGD